MVQYRRLVHQSLNCNLRDCHRYCHWLYLILHILSYLVRSYCGVGGLGLSFFSLYSVLFSMASLRCAMKLFWVVTFSFFLWSSNPLPLFLSRQKFSHRNWRSHHRFVSRQDEVTQESTTSSNAAIAADAAILRSVTLNHWGAFANASLTFPEKPCLIAITGETGSGKSMFLSSIHFGMGLLKTAKFEKTEDFSVTLSVCPAQQSSPSVLTRTYQSQKRKSVADIDGRNARLKDISEQFGPLMRFWSADLLSKLDDHALMLYLDESFTTEQYEVVLRVQELFRQWNQENKELEELQRLQAKAMDREVINELKTSRQEILALQENIITLMEKLDLFFNGVTTTSSAAPASSSIRTEMHSPSSRKEIEDLLNEEWKWEDFQTISSYFFQDLPSNTRPMQQDATFHEHVDDIDDEGDYSGGSGSVSGGLIAGEEGEEAVLMSDLHWRIAHQLIVKAQVFLKKYDQTLHQYLGKHLQPSQPASFSQTSVHHPSHSTDIPRVSNELDMIKKEISTAQKFFQAYGLYGSMPIKTSFKNIAHGFSEISFNLDEIIKNCESLMTALPSHAVSLLQETSLVLSNWNRLASDHQCQYNLPMIASIYEKKEADLHKIYHLGEILPLQVKKEKKLRDEYYSYASTLSFLRLHHIVGAIHTINSYLPGLDMGDKCLYIHFQSAIYSELLRYYNSSLDWQGKLDWKKVLLWHRTTKRADFGQAVSTSAWSMHGWDNLRITLNTSKLAMENGKHDKESTSGSNAISEFVYISPFNFNHHDNYYNDEVVVEDSEESAEPSLLPSTTSTSASHGEQSIFNILSSGECARLALAFELTLCKSNNILVLDEIDAHTGGQSVVKVAQMLKEHARKRQIIVVTHSAIIAAKADVHIQVNKLMSGRRRNSGQQDAKKAQKNSMPVSSISPIHHMDDR